MAPKGCSCSTPRVSRGNPTQMGKRVVNNDMRLDGGRWVDCDDAGTQTISLQGIDTKAGARVRLAETAPNMVLYSRPKRPSHQRNTSNHGRFGVEVETSLPQCQF